MSKQLKALMRDQLASRFADADGGIFISTQGLNSEKTYGFRSALHGRNLKFTVLRNSLARMAFKEYGYQDADLDTVLKGPVGLVYGSEEGSATSSAKAIGEWKKENKDKAIQWVGAYLDGTILGPKEAMSLKDAPTKEQARGMLAGVLQAPVANLIATIREPAVRVVYVMDALKRKLEEGGPAGESSAAEPVSA